MYQKARDRSNKRTDWEKAGVLTMEDEGPPGKNFSHVSLKHLYAARRESLDRLHKGRRFDKQRHRIEQEENYRNSQNQELENQVKL
mmetsp:Transcript_13813/g.21555  ORF Transcript_13813/g.21555 Transcript_13813/m.21555 type:complete len:86 (-) Transcript_13813:536-793(-)